MRLRGALLLGLALLVAAPSRAEESGALSEVDRRRHEAIRAGLDYLESCQNTDGSFGETSSVVGVTALAVLAFFAAGHQEGRGPYATYDFATKRGDVIRRAVSYLVERSLPASERNPLVSTISPYPPGYVYALGDSDSRMHGHCYATQALVLAYGGGEKRSQTLRQKIQLAVRVIENAQTMTGGWGYSPTPDASHEGSITVCAVQALRLAADAGFVVDRDVQRLGLRYLHESQKRDGSFKYALTHDRSSAALTAAAVTALHGFGEYYSEAVRRGIEYLREAYARPSDMQQWIFYGNYYAAQAFYRTGGEPWRHWRDVVVPYILDRQTPPGGRDGGSWDDRETGDAPRAYGPAFATAMSCLALSVQDGFLPLFQK